MKDISDIHWDVVIVGAGPAGSMAARELAIKAKSVLLVDISKFPRHKLCGSCFNQTASKILEEKGLGDLPLKLGARKLLELRFFLKQNPLVIPLQDSFSLSREKFDQALIDCAVEKGVHFLPETQAILGDGIKNGRLITLRQDSKETTVSSSVIVAANGLDQSFLKGTEFKTFTRENSYVGLGTILKEAPDFYQPGIIWMAHGKAGYIGFVRLEDDRMNIAAALDPKAIREKGYHRVIQEILEDANFPWWNDLKNSSWFGKSFLSRNLIPVAQNRVFAIGDQAHYVEPLTGEGIAWALKSAVEAVPFILRAISGDGEVSALEWCKQYEFLFRKKQKTCEKISLMIRQPGISHLVHFISPLAEKVMV